MSKSGDYCCQAHVVEALLAVLGSSFGPDSDIVEDRLGYCRWYNC